ncbi:alpha/beta-hydrolase [Atractiella rhizophila]|nr:alpha/beta-hydrolase [Atractiella rhizophila]
MPSEQSDSTVHLLEPPLRISGVSQPGLQKWLGIPYATAERWKRPIRLSSEAWTGVRKCEAFGPAPPQIPSAYNWFGFGGDPKDWVANASEQDCLTVNVYKPSGVGDNEKLPVMVWIYGGGFMRGTSSNFLYDASELVKASARLGKRVIVVTLNYRVNIFGFGGSEELEQVDGWSGNYGIYDQLQALRWVPFSVSNIHFTHTAHTVQVKSNISAFGGDPSNVTLFGQSGGSISIGLLLLRKREERKDEKLFKRAIMLSGFCVMPSAAPLWQPKYEAFGIRADGTAAEKITKLRELSTEELLSGMDKGFPRGAGVWRILVENEKGLWDRTAKEVLSSGDWDPFVEEVIMTVTKDDGAMMCRDYKARLATKEGHDKFLDTLPTIRKQLIDTYGYPNDAIASTVEAKDLPSARAFNDLFFGSLTYTADKLLSVPNASGAPTPKIYVGSFESGFELDDPKYRELGVSHALELPFIFGHSFMWKDDPDVTALSEGVQKRFLAFAYGEGPGENWPAIDARNGVENGKRLLFLEKGKVELQDMKEWYPEHRKMWKEMIEEQDLTFL